MRAAGVSSNRSFKRAYLRLASTNWPETGFGEIAARAALRTTTFPRTRLLARFAVSAVNQE